jgi:ankyrin repeat protein
MKNNSSSSEITSEKQKELDSLLIRAAANPSGEVQDTNGLTQTVAGLLAQGANVNAVDNNGDTALTLAAFYGKTDAILALLTHEEIDVNAANKRGETALILAASFPSDQTNDAVLALLKRNEINVNAVNKYGKTALMLASKNGREEVVLALLNEGANFETKDALNATLIIASQRDHTKTVLILLAQGADVNAATPECLTALMFASINGHEEVVSVLLAQGADVAETIPALLAHKGINVNAKEYFKNLNSARVGNSNAEIALDLLLSRNDFDWQALRSQLDHPTLQKLQKEVAFFLAVVTPKNPS